MKRLKIRLCSMGGIQQGFSMVSVLVSAGILGIIALASTRLLELGQKTSKSTDLRGEKAILRQYIFENLSCANTLPANPSQDCKNPLTVAISTPSKRIIAENKGPVGYRIGEWMVRATCINSDKKLLIESSRRSADGQVLKDPLTGKTQDWMDLFSGYQLCNRAFDSTVSPVRFSSMEYLGSNGCDTGGMIGGVLNVKRRYALTQTCGVGEKASTGGAQCEHLKPGWSGPLGIKQTLIGTGSSLIANYPTPDGKGWYAECCVSTTGLLGAIGSLLNITKANFPLAFIRCDSESPL